MLQISISIGSGVNVKILTVIFLSSCSVSKTNREVYVTRQICYIIDRPRHCDDHYHIMFTHTPQVITPLVSMNDCSTVDKNIDAAVRPLSQKEQTVMNEIIQCYLRPIQCKHWEGAEDDYHRQIQELKGLKVMIVEIYTV